MGKGEIRRKEQVINFYLYKNMKIMKKKKKKEVEIAFSWAELAFGSLEILSLSQTF